VFKFVLHFRLKLLYIYLKVFQKSVVIFVCISALLETQNMHIRISIFDIMEFGINSNIVLHTADIDQSATISSNVLCSRSLLMKKFNAVLAPAKTTDVTDFVSIFHVVLDCYFRVSTNGFRTANYENLLSGYFVLVFIGSE